VTTLLALGLGAGPAGAATVTPDARSLAGSGATLHLEGSTLVYTASPGVLNWPFVSSDDPGTLRIEDSGEQIDTAGSGCEPAWPDDLTTVVCPMPAGLRLELGDRNDRNLLDQSLPPLPVTVLGGPGDDTLYANNDVDNSVTLDGGEGDDVLDGMQFADTLLGGPGKDTLHGNGGDDVLRGGDGNDWLEPDTYPDVVGDDVVDGGPGYDAVQDWASMTEDPAFAISVTLDGRANDGRPGEADNVIDVERFSAIAPGHYALGQTDDSIDLPNYGTSRVEGRDGKDTITSNDGTETIDGGAGDDRLEGGYGHDVITGGPGRDTIFGDETSERCSYLDDHCSVVPFGNDTIYARDGEPDMIDCGVGVDRAVVDAVDTVANCEKVDGPASTCRVPKGLKGLTLAQARTRLRQAHCADVHVRKVRSSTVPAGRVVKVTSRGGVVTVVVSRGRR
jgi:Ca2+-binding RTX toxin-like protein